MHSLLIVGKDATALLPTATALLPVAIAPTSTWFVTLNRLVVVNGLCPLDRPQEIWLVTHWRCADDYRAWHRGHGYRESHRGIPKGLNLVGRETCIREFEVVCE